MTSTERITHATAMASWGSGSPSASPLNSPAAVRRKTEPARQARSVARVRGGDAGSGDDQSADGQDELIHVGTATEIPAVNRVIQMRVTATNPHQRMRAPQDDTEPARDHLCSIRARYFARPIRSWGRGRLIRAELRVVRGPGSPFPGSHSVLPAGRQRVPSGHATAMAQRPGQGTGARSLASKGIQVVQEHGEGSFTRRPGSTATTGSGRGVEIARRPHPAGGGCRLAAIGARIVAERHLEQCWHYRVQQKLDALALLGVPAWAASLSDPPRRSPGCSWLCAGGLPATGRACSCGLSWRRRGA